MTETGLDIAKLNDEFRRRGDGVTITAGISEIPDLFGLLEEVRWYDRFDPDNDPYCEHDFGSLVWAGQTVFWKLDYYNQGLDGRCDPLDPACRRVLTIMLAREY